MKKLLMPLGELWEPLLPWHMEKGRTSLMSWGGVGSTRGHRELKCTDLIANGLMITGGLCLGAVYPCLSTACLVLSSEQNVSLPRTFDSCKHIARQKDKSKQRLLVT